ncbi:unnamed protein product [Ceratitis capitata]|uniref:(Mediterranean fruit fly) hypothetical protein n=1 Tax=Ceratitis capitata TaxID=7213 RepID=A0A811UYN1_CERCA|nr:unnamed protein product [Ceratitis capitata]
MKSENTTENKSENNLNSHARQEKRKDSLKSMALFYHHHQKSYERIKSSFTSHTFNGSTSQTRSTFASSSERWCLIPVQCVMGFHDPTYRGCILADDMGLGKTLQCLTLACILLKSGPYGGERVLHRVLVVTPSSLTRNWEKELVNG